MRTAAGGVNMFHFEYDRPRLPPQAAHHSTSRFIDVVESDSAVCIMTERASPLPLALSQSSSDVPHEREDWLVWGLHRISVALTFPLPPPMAMFVQAPSLSPLQESGSWEASGVPCVPPVTIPFQTMGGLMLDAVAYAPPEVRKEGWSALKGVPVSAADGYDLGLLLHAVFNPSHPPLPTARPPHPLPQVSSRGAILSSVFPSLKKLLNPNLAPADMQTTISSTIDASILAPNINGRANPLPASSVSPSVNPSRSKGLRLGAGRGSSRLWNVDLIDINADGDRSAFESAPPAVESKPVSTTDSLGFGISLRASSPITDEWGAMASSSRPISRSPDPWRTSHPSQISRTLSPRPRRSIVPSTLAPAFSPASSARSTLVTSPRPPPDNAPPTSMAGMSKEEKAAGMARRMEERRLRIEKLKEQKKNAVAAAGKV
ncbi:hypothetical protein EV702DRAFT_1246718 [Suillus placidus]|uniref:Uncharacterized protein n=1 Tax=Suillus placidus TaxID=48579 RepID=A0A9P7CZS4_9AGAM|nr:hypothetical protein EV702DRAFT_1246718 [Suillus placidus]